MWSIKKQIKVEEEATHNEKVNKMKLYNLSFQSILLFHEPWPYNTYIEVVKKNVNTLLIYYRLISYSFKREPQMRDVYLSAKLCVYITE